jgi:hypothetical protein
MTFIHERLHKEMVVFSKEPWTMFFEKGFCSLKNMDVLCDKCNQVPWEHVWSLRNMVVFAVVKQLIFPKEMLFLEELFFSLGNTTISLLIVQYICSKKKHFLDNFVPRKGLQKIHSQNKSNFWEHGSISSNTTIFLGESFTYKNHLERTLKMVKTFGFGIFHLWFKNGKVQTLYHMIVFIIMISFEWHIVNVSFNPRQPNIDSHARANALETCTFETCQVSNSCFETPPPTNRHHTPSTP